MTERSGVTDTDRPFQTVQIPAPIRKKRTAATRSAGAATAPAKTATKTPAKTTTMTALFFESSTRTFHRYVLDVEDRGPSFVSTQHFTGGLSFNHLQIAREMLSARDHNSVTLVALGNACGMSAAHFAREFKKSTGLPPHQWALKNKVAKAKDMLLHSPLSLADIAFACGFVDHSHLGRWFKRMTGYTPKAWQRRHLKTGFVV